MTSGSELARAISGSTRLYGIFGHPITHSLSPLMQTFAFQHHQLDCLYVPFSVSPDHLPTALAGAIALGIGGLNITIPHKEAILPLLDEVSADAEFIDAVNTVDIRDGRTIGYNTDGDGFLLPLQELDIAFAATSACIVGAGGAARAVTTALLRAGCPELTLCNRTPERAHRLCDDLYKRFPQARITCVPFEQVADAARDHILIVNTTSVGLHPGDPELLPETTFRPEHVVYDIVYRPLHTELLEAAKQRGATIVPGIEMLIGQGAEAFRIWTDRTFPTPAVRDLVYPLI
ncbi:shikimate dehydrogenase [Candidatus Entotheonella serta]|nr:shikimate dehydrogenase [Candidatus Entotheonella serta]